MMERLKKFLMLASALAVYFAANAWAPFVSKIINQAPEETSTKKLGVSSSGNNTRITSTSKAQKKHEKPRKEKQKKRGLRVEQAPVIPRQPEKTGNGMYKHICGATEHPKATERHFCSTYNPKCKESFTECQTCCFLFGRTLNKKKK